MIVYTIINAFLSPWMDFVMARIMIKSKESADWTVAIGLYTLKDKIAIGLCLAALCICLFTSLSNLVLVIGGAVLGLVWMGVKEHD